jgi:hypothetical protein
MSALMAISEPRNWTLLTDCAETAQWGEAYFLDIEVLATPDTAEAAAELSDTRLAQLFGQILPRLEECGPGEHLIIHLARWLDCWDAPREYRERLRGEDDPTPDSRLVWTPHFQADPDPDEAWHWQQAYGAQMQVLDQCLELLADFWEEEAERRDDTLLLLTASRGVPLGEHGFFGQHPECLYDEAWHVPLLAIPPQPGRHPSRSPHLQDAGEWFKLAHTWLTSGEIVPPSPLPAPASERLLFRDAAQKVRAVRTPQWKLLLPADAPPQLYAKPDDRWEMNDVATRCRDVLEDFEQQLQELDPPT